MFRSRRKDSGLGGLSHIEASIESQLRNGKSDEDWKDDDGYLSTSSTSTAIKKYEPPEPEARERKSQEDGELVEVEPARDKDGEILQEDDLLEALMELRIKEWSIDEDAIKTTKHKEQQANRVRNLTRQYENRRKVLEALLRQAGRYAQYERDLKGYRDYEIDPETDEVVSKLMDDVIDNYFVALDNLKDEAASAIRAKFDELGGPVNEIMFRERIYRELHEAGVMANWEPMEF